ncbi:MAG: hypothetical protein CMM33_05015 [Rhodospirillaceae bacterium]|nr:hypothetical protein [Rhodospirillaceae bacterium]|tara:strand:+ start:586 stop:1905 length:1320 start_codon:yes stop_codon:yes gene_type:complete
MANAYSLSTGVTPQGVSINDSRRIFNFGDRVSELAPQQSPFFVYLSKVAKSSTDDPVFKFLEQRHQWQRRNFVLKTAIASNIASGSDTASLKVVCSYDKYGAESASGKSAAPQYFVVGQVVRIAGKAMRIKSIQSVGDGESATYAAGTAATYSAITMTCLEASGAIAADKEGQIIGSAWGEGSTDPDGWKDELYSREGYCQIFKTAIQLFSGTALATRYRGRPDEYRRVWADKLMEHKMDIEHAMLYGVGASDESASGGPVRYSHGIVPYTLANGKNFAFTYASSDYDDFIDAMKDFFSPESGNSGDKLVLTSRKILAWMNKLGSGSFMDNTVGTSQYRLDVQNIKGSFGHMVTRVNTLFGNLHFVAEPLLRNQDENLAIAIDMANVKYRPLSGNGVSRDTHIITNVQNNNVDGRKDMILTESGLEISLPETHALLTWS